MSHADDIIDGTFDYISGEYLGEGHGYPRTESSSHSGNKMSFLQNSKQGIRKYLSKRGLQKTYHYAFCIKYLEKEYPDFNIVGWDNVSETIQDNWGDFNKHCVKFLQRYINNITSNTN